MKYRKKPVVIDAVLWDASEVAFNEIYELNPSICLEWRTWDKHVLMLHTLEGDMRCGLGDYIIRDVKGELYPCKPDIFKETYEDVND